MEKPEIQVPDNLHTAIQIANLANIRTEEPETEIWLTKNMPNEKLIGKCEI